MVDAYQELYIHYVWMRPKIMGESLLNYIAGLLDADGSFSISFSPKELRLSFVVTFVQLEHAKYVVELIEETLSAGKIYKYNRPNKLPILVWRTMNPEETLRVCRKILPYLRIKRKEASLLIEACEIYLTSPRETGQRGGHPKISDETRKRILLISEDMNIYTTTSKRRKKNVY